jgi:hypothetical protein
MAFDESRNLAGVVSEQQVPFPVSWYRPIFNRGWTLADRYGGSAAIAPSSRHHRLEVRFLAGNLGHGALGYDRLLPVPISECDKQP